MSVWMIPGVVFHLKMITGLTWTESETFSDVHVIPCTCQRGGTTSGKRFGKEKIKESSVSLCVFCFFL